MEYNLEIIGWAGAILFAICSLPQAIQSIRDGHSRGLNWFFLLSWLMGEILTIIYVWPKQDIPLLTNYFLNMAFLLIIMKYKMFERSFPLKILSPRK